VGGIRRNRARDIGEWESGDNRHMFVGIDLHKSTFNAAVALQYNEPCFEPHCPGQVEGDETARKLV
jgi:hypothetical protein